MLRGKDKKQRHRRLSPGKVISLLANNKNNSVKENKNNETTKSIVLPPPPVNLNARAAKEWKFLGGKLLALGLFEDLDETALALYCEAYAEWVESGIQLKKSGKGLWIRNPKKKTMYRNPWANEQKSARRDVVTYLALFGMSPSDRAKIMQAKPNRNRPIEANEFDEF